jgi:hypothetical protein
MSFGDKENSPRQRKRMEVFAMLWLDFDFDYNDQLARKYIKYKGEYYDIGTVVLIKGFYGPVKARFLGWKCNNRGCFEPISGERLILHDTYNPAGVNDYVLDIIYSVKPILEINKTSTDGGFKIPEREKPSPWNVEVAWIWYIVIMAIGLIFKDRWLIWGFTTAVFFLWKGGFLGGKK